MDVVPGFGVLSVDHQACLGTRFVYRLLPSRSQAIFFQERLGRHDPIPSEVRQAAQAVCLASVIELDAVVSATWILIEVGRRVDHLLACLFTVVPQTFLRETLGSKGLILLFRLEMLDVFRLHLLDSLVHAVFASVSVDAGEPRFPRLQSLKLLGIDFLEQGFGDLLALFLKLKFLQFSPFKLLFLIGQKLPLLVHAEYLVA